MARCAGCCLHWSMRAVNVVVNLCGIGIIIYCLWLLKKWNDGFSLILVVTSVPQPWFVYTCLGIGIAVCLTTLYGHVVTNWDSRCTLCLYIVCMCSIIILQSGVIIAVLFKIDWASRTSKYIDERHKNFQNFIIFHLIMCRYVSLVVLVGQICRIPKDGRSFGICLPCSIVDNMINAAALATLIWAIGAHPGAQCNNPEEQERRSLVHSFLVPPNLPMPNSTDEFLMGRPSQSSLPRLKDGGSHSCLPSINHLFTGLLQLFKRRNQLY